jgi:signal transduction histidine kinase
MEVLSSLRELFLESIIDVAPIAIVAIDRRLKVQLMNTRSCQYMGLSKTQSDYTGQPITEILKNFGSNATPLVNNLLRFQFNFDLPEIIIGTRHLNVRCRPIRDGALLIFLNINNLKEKEAAAFNALLEGQELERRRFAQEIHDGIGPLISTLKMGMEGLQTTDNATEMVEIRKEAKRLIGILDIISLDIRSISHALLPASLVDYGLDSALRNLCDIIQKQTKLKISCFISKNLERLSPAIELGLYRIAQELLNNAIKYSSAKNIAVQLIRHSNSIVLMVEDDGVGFDHDDIGRKMEGIGFKNIMTRVESLHGTFSVESAAGEGVLATIELPLRLVE